MTAAPSTGGWTARVRLFVADLPRDLLAVGIAAAVTALLFAYVESVAAVALAAAALATAAVVYLGDCVDPDDAVVLDAIEDATGVRVPFVRRLVPTTG